MMDLKGYLSAHYSPTAVETYYATILRYFAYMNGKEEQGGYEEVVSYIEMLRMQQLHPKTIRNYLFGVKIYYKYLQSIGRRQDHPCRRLYLKDKINRAIATESLYSQGELKTLLQEYRSLDKRLQQRNEVVISLLVYQALNIREVINLQMQDIDLNKGEIRIKESVQLRERTLPLKPQQIMLFYHYIHESRAYFLSWNKKQSSYFIISKYGNHVTVNVVRGILRDKTAPEGIYTCQKIRQSVITHLLKTNNLRVVQVFAGHKRSSSTEAYKQTGLEELKTLVDKHHPLQ